MSIPARDCVLIFRLGSIGDTVVALPCFHAIARAFPDQRRVLLTNALRSSRTSSAESILDGTGLIDEVVYYPVGRFSLRSARALRREVQRLRPATMVYLVDRPTAGPIYRDLAFFKAAGVPRILGVSWSARRQHCAIDPSTGELEHEAERLARTLGRTLPVDLARRNWDLRLTEAERTRAVTLLEALPPGQTRIAVAPGAKIAAKDWGRDNWASLLAALAASRRDASLVLVGGRDERALCDDVASPWTGRAVNLCGLLTPRETAAALARCTLLICHDSGPMHLAASQGTPCVALFGNYNRPRRWFPFGGGHRVIHEPRGVQTIGVSRVASEVNLALESLGAGELRMRCDLSA